jgi:hypothetical protein
MLDISDDAIGWLLAIGFAVVFFAASIIVGNYLSRP